MKHIESIHLLPDKIDIGLFVSGSVAARNLLFTNRELEAQPKEQKQKFSVYDNHEDKESKDIEEGTGFPLAFYLEQAGITDVDEVKTRSVDGFESVVSEMRSRRYYFPGLVAGSSEGREPREAFVSFYKDGKRVKYFPHPTIMFGQQGLDDKNKDFFGKGIRYLITGNRDRAFWAKGNLLSCSRYFSLDQIFALNETGEDAIEQARVLLVDDESNETGGQAGEAGKSEKSCVVPIIRLGNHFWKEELEIKCASKDIYAADASGREFRIDPSSDNWLFFTGPELKQIGFYDGEHIIEEFAGIRAGEIERNSKEKEVRIPANKEQGDFYIRVIREKRELARYDYTLQELMEVYADLLKEDEYEYYNHNMNNGQGGIRKVTARGWKAAQLLELLPEIPDQEFIESGALLFQVFTKDAYKEKMAAEGNELTAYRFILAYEQDQRTQTGLEKGDTSEWDDADLHFAPIKGNTPFRIYCGKSSANPAVYKNVEGITVELI